MISVNILCFARVLNKEQFASSRQIFGGEELHNNHHAYPKSAKLSMKWYEFDIGRLYIRLLEIFGLARVKHTAPVPHLAPFKAAEPCLDRRKIAAPARTHARC